MIFLLDWIAEHQYLYFGATLLLSIFVCIVGVHLNHFLHTDSRKEVYKFTSEELSFRDENLQKKTIKSYVLERSDFVEKCRKSVVYDEMEFVEKWNAKKTIAAK